MLSPILAICLFLFILALLAAAEMGMPKDESSGGLDAKDRDSG